MKINTIKFSRKNACFLVDMEVRADDASLKGGLNSESFTYLLVKVLEQALDSGLAMNSSTREDLERVVKSIFQDDYLKDNMKLIERA